MDNHKSKNQLRKEIAALIDNIKEHSDNIGSLKRIPQIELEFITAKIKKVYEKSIVFNYLNAQDDRPALDSYTEKSIIDVEVPVFENMPDMNKYSTMEEVKTEVKVAEVVTETKVEEPVVIKEEPKTIVVETPAPVIAETPKPELVVDVVKEVSVVATPVAATVVAPPAPTKKLNDLKSYIGINDKIQFISMLFKGNADEYNNAIALLNGATELATSKNMVEQLKNSYQWEKDSDAYLNLISLIELRHR